MSARTARDVIASVPENKQFQIGEQKADAILSALRSAGWAVVPTVPSLAMCWAGEMVPDTRLTSEVYKAMLKAAQEDSRG